MRVLYFICCCRKVCLSLYNISICENLYNASHDSYLEGAQEATSQFEFYSNLCFNVPALLSVALYGSWSDTFSRKTPLLFAPIGAILYSLVFLLGSILTNSSVYYLLIGQTLDGLTGGFSCFLMAAFSYSTHMSSSYTRTSRISLVYACQTLGFMIASFTSGIFLNNTNFTVVYLTNISILLLTILYITIFVNALAPTPATEQQAPTDNYSRMLEEEENPKRPRKNKCFDRMKALFNFSHMKKAVMVTFKKRNGRKRQFILLLVAIAFLIMVTYGKFVKYQHFFILQIC